MATLYKNGANTTLTNDITAGTTSLTVSNGAEFPTVTAASGDHFYATIFQVSAGIEVNVEIVKVTDSGNGGANAVWTVVRGQDGTTAVAHQAASGGTMFVELRWLAANASNSLQSSNNLLDVASVPTARTNLGLGSMATQNAGTVAITGGSITGITDLGVADGGTGASTFTAGFVKSPGGTTALTTASQVALGSEVSGTLPISNGGTGATTAIAAFNALSPSTALGDTIYHDGTNDVKLAGNTTATRKFMRQTGTGAVSAAPAWDTLVDGDVPTALTGKTYNGVTPSALTTGFSVAGGTTSKTLTVSNTLTFTGTDASSVAFGAGGTVAYTGGKLNQFAATTSAELAGVISDETGTGSVVFGTSPSLTTPALSGETYSTSATVTAGTNAQGQGALTSDFNVITTTASNPSGVTLPTATVGRRLIIVNRGTNPVNIYPATSGTIDGGAANAAVSLPVAGQIQFDASTTSDWHTSKAQVSPVVSGLSTGLLKVTTGTGALTTATANTDYQSAITASGLLKGAGAGSISAATAGSDYLAPPTGTALLKANSGGALANAVAGTDYISPSGTETLSNKTLTAPKIADSGFVADANGNELIVFGTTASAVNEIKVTNAATGGKPQIAANGGDTNITLNLVPKGTGTVQANGVDIDTVSGAATLTNKTINLANNTVYGTVANFNAALTDGDFATLAGTESLTNKTLSTGSTWNGNTVGVAYGGTGITTYAVGDLVYASATGTLSKLADVATGNVLLSGGANVAPAYGKVGLTTHVSGTLPIGNGGTGGTTQIAALQALGVITNSTVAKSAAYTVVAADRGDVLLCTGTWTLTLTAAATLDNGFSFAVVNSGTGSITIDPNLTETIDGLATKLISPGQSCIVVCNGTGFYTLGLSGGGAVGGGSDKVFYENDQTVSTNYSITSGKNAMTAGPVTVANGIAVTIPDGSVWTVV